VRDGATPRGGARPRARSSQARSCSRRGSAGIANYGARETFFSNTAVNRPRADCRAHALRAALNLRDTFCAFLRAADFSAFAQRNAWAGGATGFFKFTKPACRSRSAAWRR